jgi:DHA1 family inner membrane transport protein
MSIATQAPARVLPALVLAQFLGVSPWFAVNAVMPDLQEAFGWPAAAVGTLTSAVQGGFVAGTLVFALLALADRVPARALFLACAALGAACTWMALAMAEQFAALWVWRALTGFFLAGIYPVGMKIAAQWFPRGLGAALGLLVGALVLGSALPHALRAAVDTLGFGMLSWSVVFHAVALASLGAGALLMLAVPAPPVAVQRAPGLNLRALGCLARDARVRASVLGYFGHMWELYTVWVLAPLIVATRLMGTAVSWGAFAVVGAGALGCALGGAVARRAGSAPVAAVLLAFSGLCCLAAPWMLQAPDAVFWAWLLLWGVAVAGDSPQFSTLTATNAPPEAVGSVLTLTNSIGFALSIVSIQIFSSLIQTVTLAHLLPWLALGPAIGLLAMRPLLRRDAVRP